MYEFKAAQGKRANQRYDSYTEPLSTLADPCNGRSNEMGTRAKHAPGGAYFAGHKTNKGGTFESKQQE